MQELELTSIKYEEFIECDGAISEEGIQRLKEILTIHKDGNVLYICHPRHIFQFGTIVENFNTKEIEEVDWDKIDFEQMLRYQDYGKYSMVEQICNRKNNAFTYLQKRAKHMMKRYKSFGTEDFHYPLVILEEKYSTDENKEFIIRGIVSCHKDGFNIAFNPQVKDDLVREKESIWQKALKFGDND